MESWLKDFRGFALCVNNDTTFSLVHICGWELRLGLDPKGLVEIIEDAQIHNQKCER